MCVTGHVRGDGGQSHSEADGLRIHEPEADEPAPCVRSGKVSHASCCNGAKYVGDGSSEEASCVVVSDTHESQCIHATHNWER